MTDVVEDQRIEQPGHLRPLYVESFRRNTRFGVRGLLIGGLFPSALMLGSLALQASTGQPVALTRWLVGAGMGPMILVVGKAALRIYTIGDRFAEVHGDRIRLGPVGYTFRSSHLVHCKIEPDGNFPEVHQLWFCFRLIPFGRPRYWSMMVEDLVEAEQFRRSLAERAACQGDPSDTVSTGR